MSPEQENQPAVLKPTIAQQSCPVPMLDGRPCGRRSLGTLVNGIPYCLMHTPLRKDNAAFQAEFERIVQEAGTRTADFTGFVFPYANYSGREFAAKCIFTMAIFKQSVNFNDATLKQGSAFRNAVFEQGATFTGTNFVQKADFFQARFLKFTSFYKASFKNEAEFRAVTFAEGASFIEGEFTANALFVGAEFGQTTNFGGARFAQNVFFVDATFMGRAGFRKAAFLQVASLGWAKFCDVADFEGTTFTRLTDFRRAKFLAAAEFRETKFRWNRGRIPGPVFCEAEFSRPEAVLFYKTYLGRALFHNCDVSKLTFSSVRWCKRKANGKWMVFEQIVNLSHETAGALKPRRDSPDRRDYGLIAELYQQLKKNYDDKRDYWTAGDYHYGEMEMKRLATPRKNQFLRWAHRHLGLVAWYKYASQYGESYGRPPLWLIAALLSFAFLYPFAGLQYNASRDRPQAKRALSVPAPQPTKTVSAPSPDAVVLTYSQSFRTAEETQGSKWPARFRLAGHSLCVSVFVALFQKDLVYEPVYLWGRILAVLEQALTSTLFALFILAVRRQFRR